MQQNTIIAPTPGADLDRRRRLAAGALARAALLMAPAMLAANALHYLFAVVQSRLLGPADYGALGALLGVVLLGGVPGLAWQSVAARHTARGDRDGGGVHLWLSVRRGVTIIGIALAAGVALGAPLLAAFLHLGSALPVLAVALCLLPLPALSAMHGLLQGKQRFRGLAFVLLLGAAVKLVVGAGLAVGLGVAGALAGVALGYALEALFTLRLVRPAEAGVQKSTRQAQRLGGEVTAAAVGILALFLLTNIDLLLARHFLQATDSGFYAAGAVVAKVAYWGPQFVVVVAFPRLAVASDPRPLLARSAAVVAVLGATAMAGAAVAGGFVVELVFGPAYGGVAPVLWQFAGLGTVLALLHLMLFASIAQGSRRVGWVLLGAIALEAALIAGPLHASLEQILTVALGTGLAALLAGWLFATPGPAAAEPAGAGSALVAHLSGDPVSGSPAPLKPEIPG